MQYRLSTLLLAFVVVWASLAVFGAPWGIAVATLLLAVAASYRSPGLRKYTPLLLFVLLCGLCLVPLLVTAVDSAWESSGLNNLKQIAIALRNYESTYGRFPPAVVADKQGNAMHSWRTLILPYTFSYSTLYSAYSFREPWNGPSNTKLAASVPWAFYCPSDPSIQGPMTSYVAVTGPGTVWDDYRTRGTPPRVLVVEVANSNINWMEPRDITLDEACRGVGDGSRPGISSRHMISGRFFFRDEVAGANVVFSDGNVGFIPAGLPLETIKGLFTGDENARKACERFQPVHRHQINWTNCTALAVLILSYAVLLFRPRDKLPPPAEPAIPCPPAAPGGN